jgi:nucleotide-binding universal stress UspA family protein
VISVLDPPDPANPMFAVTSHGYSEVLRDLRGLYTNRLHEAVAKLDGAVDVQADLLEGEPAAILAAASAELDLLAVGSRGYGALRAVVLGTHSGRLAASSRCPLLVVPRGVEHPLGAVHPRRRHARSAGR